MNILGIHDGHTATACLVKDGVLVAMVSEERFNRKKSWGGVPTRAVEWVLRSTGTDPRDVDAVALPSLVQPLTEFSISKNFPPNPATPLTQIVPHQWLASDAIVAPYVRLMSRRRKLQPIYALLTQLGIAHERLTQIEHHLAHAAASYYLSPFAQSDAQTLVITLDGSGDGLCGAVNIAQHPSARPPHIQRKLAMSSYHSLGTLYSSVTQHLGMKPNEHEYKVMGLAPYAPAELAEKARQIFAGYVGLSADGLRIVNTSRVWGPGLFAKLERDFWGIRFDAIAAGLQLRLEEIVVAFVRNWIQHTGVRTLALGGGIFMNVKLNMLLQALPEVERLFIMPSGGDESIAAGAALHLAVARGTQSIQPLQGLYLGPAFTTSEIETALRAYEGRIAWERVPPIEEKAAELLAQGHVLGRCAGRMEWGARSLGNRSILADGRNLDVVRKINAAIKQRDFWMPFAPSILWERRHDYLVNPRDADAPYMVLAFPSTPLAQTHLKAALHQYDLTCRPQLVRAEVNPGYHRLLKEWERLTGCGGLLNTSFNLHGEPIVCTPTDAIETLLRSEIDDLLIEDFWVQRSR